MKLRRMAKVDNKLRIFSKQYHNDSQKVLVIESEIEDNEYIHIKTDNEYFLIGEVINATNDNDGQKMFLYSDGKKFYVREQAEFGRKFKLR